MHRARHSGGSSVAIRPRLVVTAVVAAAGLATAVWLPTRFDSAEATERDGDRRTGSESRDAGLPPIFEDRFAGGRGEPVDAGRWTVADDSARQPRLDGDGNLVFAARPGERVELTTAETFELRTGRVEARLRLPAGDDARASFAIADADADQEIDIAAAVQRRTRESLSGEFRTFALQWGPDEVVGSVDGRETVRVPLSRAGATDALLSGPFRVRLSLTAAADRRGERGERPRLVVDDVRVSSDERESAPPTAEPTTPPSAEPTTPPPATTPPVTTPPATTPPASEPPAAEPWEPFTLYAAGVLVTFDGVRYEVKETHTSLPGWEPPALPELFQPQ